MADAAVFRFILEDGGGSPSASAADSPRGESAGDSPAPSPPSGTQPVKPVTPGQIPPPDGSTSPARRPGTQPDVVGGQIDRMLKDLLHGFESLPVFGQWIRATHAIVDPLLRNAEVSESLRESINGLLTRVTPGQVQDSARPTPATGTVEPPRESGSPVTQPMRDRPDTAQGGQAGGQPGGTPTTQPQERRPADREKPIGQAEKASKPLPAGPAIPPVAPGQIPGPAPPVAVKVEVVNEPGMGQPAPVAAPGPSEPSVPSPVTPRPSVEIGQPVTTSRDKPTVTQPVIPGQIEPPEVLMPVSGPQQKPVQPPEISPADRTRAKLEELERQYQKSTDEKFAKTREQIGIGQPPVAPGQIEPPSGPTPVQPPATAGREPPQEPPRPAGQPPESRPEPDRWQDRPRPASDHVIPGRIPDPASTVPSPVPSKLDEAERQYQKNTDDLLAATRKSMGIGQPVTPGQVPPQKASPPVAPGQIPSPSPVTAEKGVATGAKVGGLLSGIVSAGAGAVAGGAAGGAAGAIVSGGISLLLNSLGPLGMAANVAKDGLLLMTAAVKAADQAFRERGEELSKFSPEIMNARARITIAQLQADMAAARRMGPGLGRFEESRASMGRSLERLEDAVLGGILNNSNELLRLVANIMAGVEKLAPVVDALSEAGSKAFVQAVLSYLVGDELAAVLAEKPLMKKVNTFLEDALGKSRLDAANSILGIFDEVPPPLPVTWGGKTYNANGQEVAGAQVTGGNPPMPSLGL